MISSINKLDLCIVFLLHVFEYTFIYNSALIAHRRLISIYIDIGKFAKYSIFKLFNN